MGIIQALEPMIRKESIGPTASSFSHFLFRKCLHHVIRPDRMMSPLVAARGFSSRNSRVRYCDRGVVPPFSEVAFLRTGHFTSTFLLPFAPPRFAARLHRYYESSDFCRAASSDFTGSAKFVPLRRAILHQGPGPLFTQRPPLRILTMRRPFTRQISLLISLDLPTPPSPTTALPFRHGRFGTLLHRRDLPRLSPRADRSGRRDGRRAVKGSDIARSLPDRLGRIEFTCVTDGSFVSGCSPPFLTETQLPLSTSGR